MAITPGRYVDSLESFKQPTVSRGAVTLQPQLVPSDDTFTVTGNLTAPLLSDTGTIYAPTVGAAGAVFPSLVSSTDSIFAPSASRSNPLLPLALDGAELFYTPLLALGVATLSPSLVPSDDELFSPVVPILSPQFHDDEDQHFYSTASLTLATRSPLRGSVSLLGQRDSREQDAYYASAPVLIGSIGSDGGTTLSGSRDE